MEDILNNTLDNLRRYEAQSYKNMTVIGLNIPQKKEFDLMSLKTGLEMGLVEITEVDKEGSVGEVKVINNAVTPLLILDGEQIIGAKQNRIANATIIIPAESEKIIPVSCTEHGRWNYETDRFKYSNHMATSRVRRDKLESVSQSLHYDSSFKSNQGKVWENIRDTEVELNVSSNTSALNDSYKQRSNDIDDYKKAFTLHDKQNGLLVYINGRIVGLEIIYNSSRYAEYHEKLVESYIIDAISKKDEDYENEEINEDELFRQIKQSKRERFESVGLGEDYRMQNEDITGSAVIFEDNLVNASFFRNVKT